MSRACIPFHILLDFTLTRKEIALYGIIEHMESDGKHVFYNNATLAKMLDVNHESKMVSRMCRNLKSKGYITREHKEIPIKRKGEIVMEWRWCWNTVKHQVITDVDGEENDDQGVPPVHPPLVPPVHPPVVPPVHPYNTPELTPPLNTTTTCSSSFNPFEIKCLEFKIPSDERTPEEFLENVHHHVKLNSDPDSSEYQRQQMILKLLRNLHQNAAIFKSKGYVSKQTVKETEKQTQEQKDKLLWSAYQGYVNSPIEKDLRAKGIAKLEEFEEWKLKQCTK